MKAWCVPAFAKINLGLRILGKRPDGYHDLETLFLQIDLGDRLFFEKTAGGRFELTCNKPDIPVDESNLCSRAYQLIADTAKRQLGVRLHLEKNIPAGAGLGGGSSDAAITLIALNRLFALNFSNDTLYQLARQLGSDVPFFLIGGLCLGRGRGEILVPRAALPKFCILLVTPPVVVSTAWAYQNYNKLGLTKTQKNRKLPSSNIEQLTGQELAEICQNDLETAVFEKYEELAAIKAQLENSGAFVASMTGSGSAMYGLFHTPQDAESRKQLFKNCNTFVTRPIRWGIPQVYHMQY
ncbi:MAG: 4-(cytidine 5'-diphospho)-2-C-methyl-D-erythritol kinase [candidate division KSB1 bacterium]|nr:4-(cytidine 5'-diphospho)-2-C-methyl-D-erythritol kinase [candidate division KSB1 bacterium]MDZ7365268.1 4-(cytidine 5'-diphospho)-2-C-methyl-D-erythritol kinase [candidate division KSB1 bacterium]MDZ7403135.1 4-(cytidine 5'-diphospho)-2-C-methyl-D-erythritol kinase [candidate division KSB1 bacterium]